jgi:hypothetical protein
VQESCRLIVVGASRVVHKVVDVVRPLWTWNTATGEDGQANTVSDVRGVVYCEDRVRCWDLDGLELRFVEHLLVTIAVDSHSFDLWALGRLSR